MKSTPSVRVYQVISIVFGFGFLLSQLMIQRNAVRVSWEKETLADAPRESMASASAARARSKINEQLPKFPRMPETVADALRTIAMLRNATRATFVQVGANNGQLYDQLYPVMKDNKAAWIGLQVEPQIELFAELTVLHADAPDWSFYNGVVANSTDCRNGLIQFCVTKTPGEGDFRTQGQLNGIRSSCPEKTMRQVSRPCVSSWWELIYHHSGPVFLDHTFDGSYFDIDFLAIDTEGKDFDLIRMINFDKTMKPACIHYEHTYHGRSGIREEVWEMLKELGYTVEPHKGDTLACLVS